MVDAVLDRGVEVVVGGAGVAGQAGRLVQRPAQQGRALLGQVSGGALAVGGVHGDVQAGVAHRLTGGAEAAGVTHHCPDRRGGDRPDPVLGLQRHTAGLLPGERTDLAVQRIQLGVQRIEHPQRHRHGLPAGRRQALTGRQRGSPRRRGDTPGAQRRHPLVEQHRVDALHPGGVLIPQILVQLQDRPRLPHLLGGDPRGRQPAGGQKPPHQRSVCSVALGPPLTAPGRSRVRWLGQRRLDPRVLKFFDDEPPPGTRFDRESHIRAAGEPLRQPLTQHAPACRGDPSPIHTISVRVEIVERDLSTVHVEAAYDGHHETSSGS